MRAVILDEMNKEVASIQLPSKTFKSGKTGFWGQQKIIVAGKSHQVQIQSVEIVK